MRSFLSRGILIGGSLGILSAVFNITDNMPRSLLLGIIAGTLAGLTMQWKRRKK